MGCRGAGDEDDPDSGVRFDGSIAYLDQQAILRRRRALVDRLLAEPLDPDVITP